VKTALPSLLFVACLLFLLAWTASYPHSSDGPCEMQWPSGTTSCEIQGRLVPPSQHAVWKGQGGEVLASATVPRREDYLFMVAAFVFPFVVWGIGRGVKRVLSSRGRSRPQCRS